jgi:hypothetical protein
MKIKSGSGGGSTFEPCEQGLHPAVNIGVIGIGEQSFVYKGETKTNDKVMLMWEIPSLRRSWENKEGEQFEGPVTISKEYTNSNDERSHLRRNLKGWRGRDFTDAEMDDFDIKSVLGKTCQLMVIHSNGKGANAAKTYANVDNILPKKEGTDDLVAEQELVYYDPDEHTKESFSKLKEWIQKKVLLPDGSSPYQTGGASGDVVAANVAAAKGGGVDLETEDIPF